MFVEESLWIKSALSRAPLMNGMSVIDIGASSREFRTRVQPHIGANVHGPLLEKGCTLTCADAKHEDGIDLIVDLAAPAVDRTIFEKKFDLILCCNILEHVADRSRFLGNLVQFARPGSLILFTVPHRYPRHDDPIDTMYRPGTDELLSDVARHAAVTLLHAGIVSISEKRYYVRAKGRLLDYLIPFRTSYNLWRYYLPHFRWQVSCILVRINDSASSGTERS
jgi:SAM-dependent methyltransferase